MPERVERAAGIDEAGRGPVLGPMVIAGFAIDASRLDELEAIGVRDSKKISPKKRKLIGAALRSMEGVAIVEEVVAPAEIDAAVRNRSITLNGLEMSVMARIIEKLQPDIAYIDLIGHSEDKFARTISRLLTNPPRFVCRPKADETYLVTAAASIIAKTRRDAEVEAIAERFSATYGPTGSGYPGDAVTVKFLEAAYREKGIFRTSWSSYEKAVRVSHARSGR